MKREEQDTADELDVSDGDVENGLDDSDGGSADDALAAEVDDVRRELSALNDRHLRLAAEFDNYRKRTERERRELSVRSQADLAGTLLDALDDLERVLDVDAGSVSADSLLEGVQLVERKLNRQLAGAGLERVDALGQRFDPESMEALMTAPTDDPARDEHVDQVLQPGYRFKGQLIRPARVRVLKHEG